MIQTGSVCHHFFSQSISLTRLFFRRPAVRLLPTFSHIFFSSLHMTSLFRIKKPTEHLFSATVNWAWNNGRCFNLSAHPLLVHVITLHYESYQRWPNQAPFFWNKPNQPPSVVFWTILWNWPCHTVKRTLPTEVMSQLIQNDVNKTNNLESCQNYLKETMPIKSIS